MSAPLVHIGELAQQVRGVTYAKSDASATPAPGYMPLLRAGNITDNGLSITDLVYVPESKVSPKQRIVPGDVLIATSSGSISIVGKSAQATDEFFGTFGAFCKVLRPNEKVDHRYFGHFFRTASYRQKISSLAAGANINNLRGEHLDNLSIRLPAITEQQRIAGVLDRIDAQRAKRRETIALLEDLTRSVFIDMFGDPRTPGLVRKNIGDVIKVKSGTFLSASQMNPAGTHPVFGGNGINGHHDAYTSAEPRITIGRVGVYCGCVHMTPEKSWITDNALYVHSKSKDVTDKYLAYALRQARLNQYASRSAQPLISAARIYPVQIAVPPLPMQHAFADRVAAIDVLASRHQTHLAELDALFASVQERTFRGELWDTAPA